MTNLAAYRVQSPLFGIGPLPEGNLLGLPAGVRSFARSGANPFQPEEVVTRLEELARVGVH